MNGLHPRIARAFAQSAQIGMQGLHDDRPFAVPNPRPAAVLVAITERREPGLLLTQRPDTMPSHPGQIAFPGGKLEQGETAVEAALREAEEELGIDPAAVQIIGSAATFITGSGYSLTPVLAVVPADLRLRPDPREVADWFEAPVGHLFDPANHTPRVGLFRGHSRPYTEIMWGSHRIWGITAGIIAHLAHRLKGWDAAVPEDQA